MPDFERSRPGAARTNSTAEASAATPAAAVGSNPLLNSAAPPAAPINPPRLYIP